MPGVECQYAAQFLASKFRMVVAAMKVGLWKRFEKRHPALMQCGDHCHRTVDRQIAVCKASPGRFIVGLDRWPILREREFSAHVGVGVAVSDVVNQLADGPTAFSVGRIELDVTESAYSGLNVAG